MTFLSSFVERNRPLFIQLLMKKTVTEQRMPFGTAPKSVACTYRRLLHLTPHIFQTAVPWSIVSVLLLQRELNNVLNFQSICDFCGAEEGHESSRTAY